MKLHRFAGGEVNGTTSSDPNVKLALGPVTFTCTSCGEQAVADFHHMVFRSLEFYCLSCGTPYRVTNPAFGLRIKK
jgi:predicted RNA-binding Zn-ribbon protein involved in translation (DUF1610 family)